MFGLALAALVIMANGFFVAAEFALVKVRATQLHSRVRQGDRKAIAAQDILKRLDRYLSVTQVGITLASLTLGWVGEPAIEHLVASALMRLTGRDFETLRLLFVALSFSLLTFAHVLFGELVPKLVAIQRSEQMVLLAALPLRAVYFAFSPLLFILERASRVILRSMGMRPDAASEGALSEEEIVGILAANTVRSPSGQEKSRLVERVLRFSSRTARHAMVPRVDIVSLPTGTTGADALRHFRQHQYSRVLLLKARNVDEVAGYIYAKDLLTDPQAEALPDISRFRRNVLFVPESQGLVDVLREMQREHTPIAVVVDEYGGTSGLVTMEDLLEEIVGEIRDEFDEEPAKVVRVPGLETTWDVDGRAHMEELRSLGLSVEEAEAVEPIGAVVLEKLGRLARVGDKVSLSPDGTAEIMAVHRRRVTRVRVRVEPAAAESVRNVETPGA